MEWYWGQAKLVNNTMNHRDGRDSDLTVSWHFDPVEVVPTLT